MPNLTRRVALAAFAVLACRPVHGQPYAPGPVTAGGQRLAALLDGMDVERLWQHGYRIDWRTGIADGQPETAPGGHTHCSAFAAAVAERLGVYLLRPPEHGQNWLANAQERWLNSPAASGWTRIGRVGDPGVSLYAVALANTGRLVVAVYFQPPRPIMLGEQERSGHIAIVRPSEKPPALIEREGPDVIQAATTNYRSIPLRDGFAAHKTGWTAGTIEYFWHDARVP
jgi:hypothetical protein